MPEPAPTSSTALPLKSLAFIDTARNVNVNVNVTAGSSSAAQLRVVPVVTVKHLSWACAAWSETRGAAAMARGEHIVSVEHLKYSAALSASVLDVNASTAAGALVDAAADACAAAASAVTLMG
jgi:hypothetical protein